MQNWSWRYYLALSLSIIGLILVSYFVLLEPAFNDWNFKLNADLSAKFGDFIGGFIGSLFSLAGVLLLFETLNSQKVAFQNQQFETKFFELLAIYRENVREMEHKPSGRPKAKGRRVFVELRRQFGEIYQKVNDIKAENKYEIDAKDIINISFIILFLGIGETTNEILDRYLEKYKKSQKKLVEQLFNSFSPEQWSGCKLDGHQSRLGHYYRHLYQMVTFIDKTDYLSDKEKYFYVKTLRAQMSTFELAMFFINSLSDFGQPWTIGDPNLIMKYKFIKNIPSGFIFDIKPSEYYPMKYEEDERSQLPISTEIKNKI